MVGSGKAGKVEARGDLSVKNVQGLDRIAAAAGVSISTVSRALAGSSVVNAKTRARIEALAKELGYRPNRAAQSLRLGRTQTIGVVLPLGHETTQHLSDPFFMTLLGYLGDELSERGYDLLLSKVVPRDDAWLDRLTRSGRVDGVIVIGQSDQADVLNRAGEAFAPLVVWGALLPGQSYSSVGTDNVRGGQLATEHLIATGRRKLLFLGDPSAPEIRQRHEGFLHASEAAQTIERYDSLPVHLVSDAAYDDISRLIDSRTAPDGIVAASDVIAMNAIRVLTDRGLSIPSDVAIIGYDDISLASHTAPPLTTIRQDLRKGASCLVDILFRRLGGEKTETVVLPPELIVRGSA